MFLNISKNKKTFENTNVSKSGGLICTVNTQKMLYERIWYWPEVQALGESQYHVLPQTMTDWLCSKPRRAPSGGPSFLPLHMGQTTRGRQGEGLGRKGDNTNTSKRPPKHCKNHVAHVGWPPWASPSLFWAPKIVFGCKKQRCGYTNFTCLWFDKTFPAN